MELEIITTSRDEKKSVRIVEVAGTGHRIGIQSGELFVGKDAEENCECKANLKMIFYRHIPISIDGLVRIPEGARWAQYYSRSDPNKIAFYAAIDDAPGYRLLYAGSF